MEYTSLMIIDDYLLVAEGVKELIRANLKPRLIKHFNAADNAKKELRKRKYQYVFIGINMHGRIGADFISLLRKEFPQLVIIVLCSDGHTNSVSGFFALGVNGIISKSDDVLEIKLAAEKTAQGEQYISAAMALPHEDDAATTDMARISKRENEVMRCVANGKSILETASLLQLSHHTVITYRRNIMEKLGLKSAAEMASYAYKHQLY